MYLDFKYVGQLLSFSLPYTVSCIGHKDNWHLVLPIPVHQIPEALFGRWDGCSSTHKNSIDIKQKSKGGVIL